MKVYLEPATAIEHLFTAALVLQTSGGGISGGGGIGDSETNLPPEDL